MRRVLSAVSTDRVGRLEPHRVDGYRFHRCFLPDRVMGDFICFNDVN